jgi:thiamine-monophosphate kinase
LNEAPRVALGEFDLIRRYFARPVVSRKDVRLGIGDDCALLAAPGDLELAATIDTLVAGVHFGVDTHPRDLGYKTMAVNLSDLAAMGAEPAWAMLALTLPTADGEWLAEFAAGLFRLAEEHDVQLVGGDTTRGPLTITMQVQGFVPPGQALRRSGARPGDLVYVSGDLGAAALALRWRQGAAEPPDAAALMERLDRPRPRILEGRALRGIATAAIDVSDGVAADLGHILQASGVGATVCVEDLPMCEAVAAQVELDGNWDLPLSGGEDYELCFTVPPEREADLQDVWRRFACGCRRIGVCEEAPGLRYALASGDLYVTAARGYQHFSGEA